MSCGVSSVSRGKKAAAMLRDSRSTRRGPVLAAEAHEPGPLVAREAIGLAGVDVGLDDPAPQRFVGDARIAGDLPHGMTRLAGASHALSQVMTGRSSDRYANVSSPIGTTVIAATLTDKRSGPPVAGRPMSCTRGAAAARAWYQGRSTHPALMTKAECSRPPCPCCWCLYGCTGSRRPSWAGRDCHAQALVGSWTGRGLVPCTLLLAGADTPRAGWCGGAANLVRRLDT